MTTNNSDSKTSAMDILAHKQLMDNLYHAQSVISHIALPEYLTNEERDEWRDLLNQQVRDFNQIIDKCSLELYREEWYGN